MPGIRSSHQRRQSRLVRAASRQPGQGRRRGALEHGPQLSMMDLELPPPGLPSQQVLPWPSRPHCGTRTGAGARGSRSAGRTATTGTSSRLWQEPGLQRPRTGLAALAPGRGGAGSGDLRGGEGSKAEPGGQTT